MSEKYRDSWGESKSNFEPASSHKLNRLVATIDKIVPVADNWENFDKEHALFHPDIHGFSIQRGKVRNGFILVDRALIRLTQAQIDIEKSEVWDLWKVQDDFQASRIIKERGEFSKEDVIANITLQKELGLHIVSNQEVDEMIDRLKNSFVM